jgi:threonine/homoserine/homoserine lactone efflux protein
VTELLPIAAARVVIVVSPGPNVLAVTLGAAQSRWLGDWTAVDVSTIVLTWYLALAWLLSAARLRGLYRRAAGRIN